MHFGTLIAALVSYLRARSRGGRWLLRMEDVDVFRKVRQADSQILHNLERFGFEWDGEVVYQTQRTAAYEDALSQLKRQQRVYPCTCSRKQLARQTGEWSAVYPGTCRQRTDWSLDAYAIRIRTPDRLFTFEDRLFGVLQQNIATEVGDFVIKRRDGVFAYQLAVVVDDAWQGVTEVVRGTDLIDSTARQIFLQQCLDLPTPDYFHFPVLIDSDGRKLSKSTAAVALDDSEPVATLNRALTLLGQARIDAGQPADFWPQAIRQWDENAIPRQQTVNAC